MYWLNKELNQNEEVIFRTRSHRFLFFVPVAIMVMTWIDLLFLYGGIFCGVYVAVKYLGNEYIITNQRVIIKKGFFDISTEDIPINFIEDVLIRRSYYDKIIRGGTVVIFGEEMNTQKIAGMDKPITFRDALYSQISASTLSYYEEA